MSGSNITRDVSDVRHRQLTRVCVPADLANRQQLLQLQTRTVSSHRVASNHQSNTMPKVRVYHLKPTMRIPNSHFPLLHYPGCFGSAIVDAGKVFDVFNSNGWTVQWIYRYGKTQASHYHSTSHECMAVLTGHAMVRFGVADTSSDLDENTYGADFEAGGLEIAASAGDVFVIPAGIAHKTYDTNPQGELSLLTPGGDGSRIEADDPREAVSSTQLSGFTMLGAYPVGSEWDFKTGTPSDLDRTMWSEIWGIAAPEKDPVLGLSADGLRSLWQRVIRRST